jgi:hypothetical protein
MRNKREIRENFCDKMRKRRGAGLNKFGFVGEKGGRRVGATRTFYICDNFFM